MTKLLFIFILMASFQAHAADPLCYQKERNPNTRQTFASEDEYQQFRERWADLSPGVGNPFALIKAYNIYKKEKAAAQKMRSDKLAHCYIGCRISQETSYHTADYVGWLKEDRDISDCSPNTRFDEEDYRATVRGAQFGESQNDANSCLQACKQVYNQ